MPIFDMKNNHILDIVKKGYMVCSLGAVYVFGNVSKSIPEAFCVENKLPKKLFVELEFPRPVFENLNEWNSKLVAIQAPYWEAFKMFVTSITLKDIDPEDNSDKFAKVIMTAGRVIDPKDTAAHVVEPLIYDLNVFTITDWAKEGQEWSGKLLRPANGKIAAPALKMEFLRHVPGTDEDHERYGKLLEELRNAGRLKGQDGAEDSSS